MQSITPINEHALNADDVLKIAFSPNIVEHPSMSLNHTHEMSIPSLWQKDSTAEKNELVSLLGSLTNSRKT